MTASDGLPMLFEVRFQRLRDALAGQKPSQKWRVSEIITELDYIAAALAAPVGGQAEPSDAEIDAAARALNPGEWWDWPNHAAAEQRSVWRGKARDALRAAAAVSGEQATNG